MNAKENKRQRIQHRTVQNENERKRERKRTTEREREGTSKICAKQVLNYLKLLQTDCFNWQTKSRFHKVATLSIELNSHASSTESTKQKTAN